MPKAAVFKTSLDLLYYSGASRLLSGICAGTGAIFMLHHVCPGGGLQQGFAPNSGLELTPAFLESVINFIKARGFELVTIAEAARRIGAGAAGKPFAVFTLDDGYRDNLVHALPVFARHNCPFTIYVAPAITDGTSELWWRGLERVIDTAGRVVADVGGQHFDLPVTTDAEKQAAWEQMYWPVRRLEQHEQRRWIADFCKSNAVDLTRICTDAAMTWDELRQIAAHPLCTIGAHTINHFAVSQLSADEAYQEMVTSADIIEAKLGQRPEHFAYPYGDEDSAGPRDFALAARAGFKSAVTTRKGMIYPEHANHLCGLPRVSLAGHYQKLRYVDTLLSGVPFTLFNKMRQINVN